MKFKSKLLGNTVAKDAQNQADGIRKNVIIAVPLKYLVVFGDHSKCHN